MARKLSETDTFVLLGNRRRRLLLRVLRESTTPLQTTALAERIVERERKTASVDELRAIHLSLYHDHLPRFADADVVVYSPDERSVHPGPNFDDLVRVLDGVNERDLPWSGE